MRVYSWSLIGGLSGCFGGVIRVSDEANFPPPDLLLVFSQPSV